MKYLKLLKSKTVWISILMIAIPTLQYLQTLNLSEQHMYWVVALLGFVNFLNRLITSVPVTQYIDNKQEEELG